MGAGRERAIRPRRNSAITHRRLVAASLADRRAARCARSRLGSRRRRSRRSTLAAAKTTARRRRTAHRLAGDRRRSRCRSRGAGQPHRSCHADHSTAIMWRASKPTCSDQQDSPLVPRTFDRRQVLQAWCTALQQGAPVGEIEALCADTLANAEVVALEGAAASVGMRRTDRRRIDPPNIGHRYTTDEMLALELRLVCSAYSRASERAAGSPNGGRSNMRSRRARRSATTNGR